MTASTLIKVCSYNITAYGKHDMYTVNILINDVYPTFMILGKILFSWIFD